MTPHLNRLVETVQKKGHNICFHAELTKIIHNYDKYSVLSRALVVTLNIQTGSTSGSTSADPIQTAPKEYHFQRICKTFHTVTA